MSGFNSQAGLQSIRAGIPSAHLAASRRHDRAVAAKALRDAAGECRNGAGDPYQEFYDRGVAQWLTNRADAIEAGEVDL